MKEIIVSAGGIRVPCLSSMTGVERLAVITGHGFGSSANSPLSQSLADELSKIGAGIIAPDMPGHGARLIDEELTFPGCLDTIAAVELYIIENHPSAQIGYFAVSFSAYLTLMYLALRPHTGKKALLCSAALDMSGLLRKRATDDQRNRLTRDGYYIREEEGWAHPIKITRSFLNDLAANNVFSVYEHGCSAELFMLHGGADTTAPIDDTCRFARLSGAGFIEIPEADHMLRSPGCSKILFRETSHFFA